MCILGLGVIKRPWQSRGSGPPERGLGEPQTVSGWSAATCKPRAELPPKGSHSRPVGLWGSRDPEAQRPGGLVPK